MKPSEDLSKYQAKSITPVDEYVCTLSEELQKLAFEKFGETEELREKSIKEIREWALNSPRLEMLRLDAKYILRFCRRFNYKMAQIKETIERLLLFRQSGIGKEWTVDLNIDSPGLLEMLDAGIFTVLPTLTEDGHRVIAVKFSACNPKLPNAVFSAFCVVAQVLDAALEDEENQIRGFVYIFDISNITLRHYSLLSISTWYKILKCSERTCGGQHNGCHIINMSSALAFIANLAKRKLEEKNRDRIHVHSSFDDFHIIDKDELPEEFGGKRNLTEIIEPWRKLLLERRELMLKYSQLRVNHDFYSTAAKNCDGSSYAHLIEDPKSGLLKSYSEVYKNEEGLC